MDFDASQIPWREPWGAIPLEQASTADAELRREVCRGHVLYGRATKAMGERHDCDDVLFYLGESPPCFAVVHLTYNRETRPEWPYTALYDSLATWVEQCMIPEAEEFHKIRSNQGNG